MSQIFENDSDSDFDIKTDNEYAKNYNKWRNKEELNKFKTKYGEELLEENSSSSSDDDEEGVELTEEVEKQFFKTLSYLKNKDPRIYDEHVTFFEEPEESAKNKKKTKKEKALYIDDYQRELILKKNGELSDSDEFEEDSRSQSPTYVEEQKKLKENFKKALNQVADDEDDDGEWGGMLKVRHKTQEEKNKEEVEYKEWLAGQKDQIDDKEAETELKPLKEYWNDPKLDDGEKFLRDYVLQKKFLSKEDEDYIPTYEEIIHDSDQDLSEDEEAIEKQEEFEHKYNFRYEEPDQEFIKRYPRTMEQSLRKTDDRRKIKRVETKERKQKEKEQKMQELKKLQELKRKEIEEKIEKLKEITGNNDIEFNDEDLDGDFDPEAHDRKMQSLFNDEYYEGPEGDQKPEFPEIDEFLEIENWKKWEKEDEQDADGNEEYSPHCEDEDFNMDCDYDPTPTTEKELIENSKGKKKRKRKSLFAKAVSKPKPVFDPSNKTYEEYLDEYYKLECEDIIGDIPCKFKYRKVMPNDFGLSVEEILLANDRELNKWCSLKKAVQIRPDHVEKYEQIAYAKKAQNVELKRKLLPSLFENEKNDDKPEGSQDDKGEQSGKKKKKKAKKVRCKKSVVHEENQTEEESNITKQIQEDTAEPTITQSNKKNKNEKQVMETIKEENVTKTNVHTESETTKNKKKKKKNKSVQNNDTNTVVEMQVPKKRKLDNSDDSTVNKRRKKNRTEKAHNSGISDARLSAYGINPKKFKNKLKYGKS